MMLKWKKKKEDQKPENLVDQEELMTEIPLQTVALREKNDEVVLQQTVVVNQESMLPDMLKICAASLIGGRNYQQDTIWYGGRREDALAVVCDGMGGLEGGELASACAISVLLDCYWQEDIPVKKVPSFFYQSMQMMNRAVCNLQTEDGKTLECGTTAVSVYICQDRLFWFSVGDSKIYLVREGKMLCPFEPHNYRSQLEHFLKEGTMSETEFERESTRGDALISFLGSGPLRIYEISQKPFSLQKGDRVILCSDGLYRALSEEQILNIVEMCQDSFMETADVFVQAVRNYGKKPLDNVSVICISYEGDNTKLKK